MRQDLQRKEEETIVDKDLEGYYEQFNQPVVEQDKLVCLYNGVAVAVTVFTIVCIVHCVRIFILHH